MTTPSLPPRPISGLNLRPIERSDLAGYGSAIDFEGGDLDLDYEYYELGLSDRIRAVVGHVLIRVGWVVLAAALAFGSAGIIAATDHVPSSGARPELTWSADQALSARLDSAVRDLARLQDDVDSLSDMARQTLASMAQLNQQGLQTAWNGGWNDVNSIDAGAASLTAALKCSTWDATVRNEMIKTTSPALVDRYHNVCVAITSVAPLHDNWQAMVDDSATALRVVQDIENHDSNAATALQSATQGRYSDALSELASATASLADATTIATTLAKVTDVSTLTSWLSRTQAFDDALRLLWQTMIASKGKVTAQVTTALRAVNDAKALLPTDNSALQVVVYEAAGDVTANGISIETARGALADALGQLTGGTVVGQ